MNYINTISTEICKELLLSNGLLFEFIDNQNNELCEIACKNNINAYKFINDKSYELDKKLLYDDGRILQFIDTQTDELCEIAIKNNYYTYNYIKNKSTELDKKLLNALLFIDFKKAFDKLTNDSISEFNKCFLSTHIVISRFAKLLSISYDLLTGQKVIKKNKDGNIVICDKNTMMEKYESKIEELESKINKFKELAKNNKNNLNLELSDDDDEDGEDEDENTEKETLNDDE
jgi:translation elongation factor P/translation initiation factor 5A